VTDRIGSAIPVATETGSMYEVELKVRADHNAVRDRLTDLGATHLGVVGQTDTYYDAPHRDFAETDEALRLRTEEGADEERTTRLTYKGPLVEEASKTRQEIETTVPDADAVDGIFQSLGFGPVATVRKERDRYELGGYHVVLDDVDGLDRFVEVEASADEDDLEAVRDGARAVLERLDLDPDAQIRASYLGMFLGDA